MFTRKTPIKHDSHSSNYVHKPENLPDTALAAIMPFKKHKDVSDFISFVLEALERNAHWINSLVGKRDGFKCALMTGSGPNRFQIHQVIYPSEGETVSFEIECRDSEDYDKVAIAAILKLTNVEIDRMLKYIKTRLFERTVIREELSKGKLLGISYAVLRPLYDKQYRMMERIVIGSSVKCASPVKRRLVDKSIARNPLKRAKKVA
ncbi:unnamed protein product, partial [Iphiclides podalirius]